ncbi:GFA family protein [Janthinobacterium sp. HLX7-2]|uniref:GFA family protein n=1 Tax=Janthinobacterium sp. HLX7-2 TaxID=1259331 RepID=UPI003F265A10
MLKTYQGSCHCGAVRFEAELDLSAPTLRCNCSFCRKLRCWSAMVAPSAFRLLAGAQVLGEYQFGARREHHYFCQRCGVRPFGKGVSPRRGPFHGISVSCLDGVSDAELAGVPVTFVDGLHDEWDLPPQQTRHL